MGRWQQQGKSTLLHIPLGSEMQPVHYSNAEPVLEVSFMASFTVHESVCQALI